MKVFLSSILELSSDLKLEYKFFNFLTFFGGIIALFLAPLSFFIDIDLQAVIVYLIFGLVYLALYLVGRIKRSYRTLSIILVIFTIFICDPILWFTNGGASGITAYFFMYDALILGVLLYRERYLFFIFGHLIMIAILYTIEYHFPHLILGYTTKKSLFINQSSALIVVCAFLFFSIKKIIEIYNRKSDQCIIDNKKIDRLLTEDSLCGVLNRTNIINKLEDILKISGTNSPLAVLLISIDSLKQINDKFGYLIGDKAIRKVSQVLQEELEENLNVGRVDGKKFLIILEGRSANKANEISENIKKKISKLEFRESEDLKAFVNIGIYKGNSSRTLDEIIEYSERCLTQARRDGGNCVRASFD